mgnify:CR=1 FL=1
MIHTRHSRHVLISSDVKVPPAVLRPHKRQQNHICIHGAHEDANHQPIAVAAHVALGRQREALANRGLNRRRRRRNQVPQLVARADDKGPERAGRQLHQVDWDDAPRALDAELLEKRGRDDGVGADKGVRVQQRGADEAHDDDAEAAAEDGRAVADEGAAGHGAQVGNHLRHGHAVGREVVLVAEHRRVQVLRAVRHEVEPGHQEHHVHEQEPVLLERVLALVHKHLGRVGLLLADPLPLLVRLGLGEAQAEEDDQHWRAGAEPEQRAPAVADRVDERAGEDGG